jgi:protein-ribulosamine 3-kinase
MSGYSSEEGRSPNWIFPIMKLDSGQIHAALETAVSNFLGKAWHIAGFTDLSDFACHPCGIFSDGAIEIFAKFSGAFDAAAQFEIEMSDLQHLSKTAGVEVPKPIGVVPVADGILFIMEAHTPVERGASQWRLMGKTLAQIHRIKSDDCGFHWNNYFGPLPQDNTPVRDWATFFGKHRLLPRLKEAADSGNLPSPLASRVEKIISRLPEICGPDITPSLLHGDAQQNYFITTEVGVVGIDPAVYYSNPEMDLASIDYFQPVAEGFFDGYRDELPIDPGFRDRCDLWRIPGYLAVITVEGPDQAFRLISALKRYE